MESLKKEMEKQENELATQKSTLEAQQSATQQLLQGVQEIRLAKEKGDSQIQAIWSESDQNIGRLRSKIGVLESNGDLLRTKLARMAMYLEDPVWIRVQEEIMRREYGKIQSRERSRRLELHLSQQFELLKTKMEDSVAKVLTVQKKLIADGKNLTI